MDGKKYIIDLDAIMNFVMKQDESRTSNSEITEMYAQDEESEELILVNKQLREIKNNGDTSAYTLRYDLIKTLMTVLDEMSEKERGEWTILQSITFDSLLTQGIIKEVKNE